MTQKIPELVACPRCALNVQRVARGGGAGGLAFHDCGEVERLRSAAAPSAPSLTPDAALEQLLAVACSKATTLPAKDLVALVAHVGRMREVTTATPTPGAPDGRKKTGSLLAFLRDDDPDLEAGAEGDAADPVGVREVG